MRVLFTTFAARTHVHSQVPLAWALRAAGHDVRVATQPDAVEHVLRAGLSAVPVGAPLNQEALVEELDERRSEALESGREGPESLDYLELTDISEVRPERLTYELMHRRQLALAAGAFPTQCDPEMIDDLVRYARWWRPDLVVWDTMTFAGPVAAMASGAAHARLLFGLDLIGFLRQHYNRVLERRIPALRDDPMAEWLGWTLEEYGCRFTEEAVVGQWTIDPVPTSLALPTDLVRVPMRYVPYNGPAVLPDWVLEPPRRPRVCVTLGLSLLETLGRDRVSVAEILDAVAALDVEVVATVGAARRDALGTLPARVRVVDFVPLDALLPSCAAVVHHGGAGTYQSALAHAVPQIILPDVLWDSARRAEGLERSGAGLQVADPARLTAAGLRDLVRRVLDDPAPARQARRLRREMAATAAPADVVPVLERLTAHHRPAVRRGL
ncbi:activator-dependent family glycosyltransferase [Streptomyces sp. NPDC059256]|uniref:activator-dependent family glycosyltransferase n=1 Tax=Streptomyces sp. NPDC059256 TaxID=3346794 RepID=UPI0036C6D96F